MTTKTRCKCKTCGQPYLVYSWEHYISKNTFVKMFEIEDQADPSKNKRGIAVTHCAKA